MASITTHITVRDTIETPSPYVGSNGNWYAWDPSQERFVDTGTRADGHDGQDGTNLLQLLVHKPYGSQADLTQTGEHSYKVVSRAGSMWPRFCHDVDYLDLEVGAKYTLQCWIRGKLWSHMEHIIQVSHMNSSEQVFDFSPDHDAARANISETEWYYYSGTSECIAKTNSNSALQFFVGSDEGTIPAGYWLEIKDLKLERGDHATPYSEAPEDTEERLRQVRDDLAHANTLVKGLEEKVALKLDRDDLPDISHLLASFQKGTVLQHQGIFLTNDLILSDINTKEITAKLSGGAAYGTKSLRLGINYGSGGPEEGETTALSNDGTGHLGDLYFDGNAIGFGAKDRRYMQIGGNAPSESSMINAATEIRAYQIQGVSTDKETDLVVDYFDSQFTNREVRYVAKLQVSVDATAVREGTVGNPNSHLHSGNYYASVTTRGSAQLILRLSRSGTVVKEVKSQIVSLQAEARGGDAGPHDNLPQEQIHDHDDKTISVDLRIPGETVRAWDNVQLLLYTTMSRYGSGVDYDVLPSYSRAYFGVKDIVNYLPHEKTSPMVSVTKDRASFFYGRSSYLLFNYVAGYLIKAVGNMLLQGDLKVTGKVTADEIDAPGAPLCGGRVDKTGSYITQFGKYVNKYGSSSPYVYKNYSTNEYTVSHSIDSLSYVPFVMPYNDPASAMITNISYNSFSFRFTLQGDRGSAWAMTFHYVCFKAD